MNIACDLDGVLVEFNQGYAALLHKLNPAIKLDTLTSSFPQCWRWDEAAGYSADTIKQAWTEIRNSGQFWLNLNPYATAYEDIKFLANLPMKHNVYFVTTRPGDSAKWESEQWLIKYGFNRPTVVISENKVAFCHAIAADMIIDDRPENMQYLITGTKAVLFKRPYNIEHWPYFSCAATVREALCDVV